MTKRKGFMLVELLIVVFIIGILTSMMTVSSSDSIDAADAVSIIGNLSTMKRAAFAINITSRDEVASITEANLKAAIANYIGVSTNSLKSFDVAITTDDKTWYVYYDTGETTNANKKVQKMLKSKAAKIGLLGSANKPTTVIDPNTAANEYSEQRYAILKVF